MKKIIIAIIFTASIGFLAGCQNVSSKDIDMFFEQDLTKLSAPLKLTHPEAKITGLDVDFDGKKIKVELHGQDANQEFEMTVNPFTQEILKDKSEKLDREDKLETVAELPKFNSLKSLQELKTSLLNEKIALDAIESMELSRNLSQNIWEVQVKEKAKEINYFIDAQTGNVLGKEVD